MDIQLSAKAIVKVSCYAEILNYLQQFIRDSESFLT